MPVLSFALRKKTDWTNVERAEFVRIHKLLSSFGLHVAMEMGLSDENDPWCVFDLIETGETLVHFARIDGALIAHDIITDEIVKAASLTELAELIMAKYPSISAGQGPKASDNVIAFPGAYLTGFVAAVYFFSQHTGRAQASDETNAFSSFVSEQIETMNAEKDDDKQERDLAREHNLDGLDGLQQARNQSDNSQLAFSQFTKVLSGSVAAALLIFSGFEAVDTQLDDLEQFVATDLMAGLMSVSENGLDQQSAQVASSDTPVEISNATEKQSASIAIENIEAQIGLEATTQTALLKIDQDILVKVAQPKIQSVTADPEIQKSPMPIQLALALQPEQDVPSKPAANSTSQLIQDLATTTESATLETAAGPLLLVSAETVAISTQSGVYSKIAQTVSFDDTTIDPFNSGFSDVIILEQVSFSQGNMSQLALVKTDEMSDYYSSSSTFISSPTETAQINRVEPVMQDKVLGHRIGSHFNNEINLDGDILDVLLYTGGDTNVRNFQIGYDRIWFLDQSAPQIIASVFTDDGDLQLHLSDNATITLVGVQSQLDIV